MPTIEERLRAIEQEHADLKKTIELQTIAIGALVNKATLEKLNEKYDRLFETLIAHDRFTNEQLAELRRQQIEEDGKIVGLQTEMRQRFNSFEERFNQVEERFDKQENKITGLETTLGTRIDKVETLLTEQATLLQQILARLPKNAQ